MKKSSIQGGRQEEIIRYVAGRIRSGEYSPGQRLPTRDEFEQIFSTTRVTVQRAFDRMIACKSVIGHGKGGTYVCENPPQLNRFVLTLPAEKTSGSWVKFWETLRYAAAKISAAQGITVDVFTRINEKEPNNCRILSQQVREHSMAGIVFGTSPHEVDNTPIVNEPGVPRVAFMSKGDRYLFPVISFDAKFLINRAVCRFAELGRKKLAVLFVPGLGSEEVLCYLRSLCAQHGMCTSDHWLHTASQGDPKWVRHILLSVFHRDIAEKPDALLILDDNLAESACTGLMETRTRVPEDITVIAHANFPCPQQLSLPFLRLGYDTVAGLELALGILRRQALGQEVENSYRIAPMFEEEVAGGQKNLRAGVG